LENVTNESPAALADALEDFIGLHAQDLLSIQNAGEVDAQFRGPWTVPKPASNRLRGTQVANGEEIEELERMVERVRQGRTGEHILFPGTHFGADVIICARNDQGQVVLWKVQCKARFRASTNEAPLRSLEFPYHINRSTKKPELPTEDKEQLKRLETIMRLEYVKVGFVVLKYPARSKSKVPTFEVKTYSGWGGSSTGTPFPVLIVTLDGRTIPERCPKEIVEVMERLLAVKSLH